MDKIELTERSSGKPYEKEEIHISKTSLKIRINTITGKDGDFWLVISPSLAVSGYGDTKEDAEKSFDEHIDIFAKDLNALDLGQRLSILKDLGWEQGKFFKKRLSKVFVDENGVLKNLEHAEINSNSLESVI